MHILLTGNTSFKIANFRAGLIRALLAEGHEITVLAPYDNYTAKLQEAGCSFVALEMERNGTSPVAEATLLAEFFFQIRKLKPDFVFSYTIKNNIYAGLACRALNIPFAPNVTGLGPAFNDTGVLSRCLRTLYKLAFRRARSVFFQNQDDLALFISSGMVPEDRAHLLPGSGVDLERFRPSPFPSTEKSVRFLLIARMLWDKGVGQFVDAARLIRTQRQDVQFQLLGPIDVASKTAIARSQIQSWVDEGCIEYLGETHDVVPALTQAHCLVLPSYYREGTPRTLLEAAATARPIITTDMPGCREAVLSGVTGFVVRPRDSDDLVLACERFLQLSPTERKRMGEAGRARMEAQYDERIVIENYRALLLGDQPQRQPL